MKIVLKPILASFVAALATSPIAAGLCDLVGGEVYGQDAEETFLGVVTDNPYASASIINEFGQYGSRFSATSISNEFGSFGSEFSNFGAYNEFATKPPVIYLPDGDMLRAAAFLSTNKFLAALPVVDPGLLLATLKAGCGGTYVPPTDSFPDLVLDSLVVRFAKTGDTVIYGALIWNIGGASTIDSVLIHTAINGKVTDSAKIGPIAKNGVGTIVFRGIQADDSLEIAVGANVRKIIGERDYSNNEAWGLYIRPSQPVPVAEKPKSLSRSAINKAERERVDALGRFGGSRKGFGF